MFLFIKSVTTTKSKRDLISDDYRRIDIIKRHRTHHRIVNEDFHKKKVDGFKTGVTIEGKKPVVNSLVGLKEVFLRDCDFTKDRILKGHILTLELIDVPILPMVAGQAIALVGEDEHGYAERVCVYNIGEDYEKILDTYDIGAKIAIVNPYVRMAMDGKPVIRVDDPKTVIFVDEKKKNVCRYCGQANAPFKCQQCKNAYYCSKDCQTDDWKILKHKIICSVE